MQVMARYPDGYFDLAIVDPPYGINVGKMNMGAGKSKKSSKIKNRKWKPKGWDSNTPDASYFHELKRVSKDQIRWGGNHFELPPCYGYVVWDKGIPDGLTFADCEFAWLSIKKAARIFRYSAYLDKKEKTHPTQKPVALYKWLLKNYATPDMKILDTHGGSFSIALALHDFGIQEAVICEIDKEYYDNGVKRFEQHKKQLTFLHQF